MRAAVLILSLVFGFISTSAQVTFSSQQAPGGGNVGDIEINSSSHIFIFVKPGGTPAENSFGAPLAGSVYRSTNNGTNWTKLSIGTNGLEDNDAYDILIDGDDNIYVLGKQKIYKSSAVSNGDSWTSFSPSSPFEGGSQLAKTADGELYLMNEFSGVFRSLDDGATWSNISNNLPSPTNYVSILARDNDVFVGVLNNGIYRLPNGSVVWSDFNSGASATDTPGSLALKGSTLYQTNRSGAYYHNGTNWVIIAQQGGGGNLELNENFNNSDHQIVIGPGTKLFIVFEGLYSGQGKVYYSDNDTDGPWTELNIFTEYNQAIWAMKSFTAGNSVFAGLSRNGIIRSINSGGTWDLSNGGLLYNPGLSVIRADEDGSGFRQFFMADGSPYLFRSYYGSSWDRILLNFCTSCQFSTVFKKSNGDLLAIGNDTYRSTDDGNNWADAGTGPPVFLQQVASGTGNVYYGYRLASGTHSYYQSNDPNAVTWSTLTLTGLPASYKMNAMVADASNNLYLYINDFSGGTTDVYKVNSGATTANKITNLQFGNDIRQIREYGGEIYVLGYNISDNQYQIARTSNGASSWTRINVRSLHDFVLSSFNGVLVGGERTGGKVDYYLSNDAGATWNLIFSEVEDSQLLGGAIDEGGHMVLAMRGAPVYQSNVPVIRPNAPTGLQAVSNGQDLVVLEWDHDGEYVNHFEVGRRILGETTFVLVGDFVYDPERFYEDFEVAGNTTYEYRITAVSPAGNSSSSIIHVTTNQACDLTIPDNRSWTGTVSGFSDVTIGIQKLSGDSYYITDFTAGSVQSITGDSEVDGTFYGNCGSPFIDPTDDLFPDGVGSWDPNTNTLVLNFQTDKADHTESSQTITLVLNDPADEPAPAKATGVSALIANSSAIEINWSAGLFQSEYLIEKAVGAGAYSTLTTVAYPSTSFVDEGSLTVGTTYKYRVTARNLNGVAQAEAAEEVTVAFRSPFFELSDDVTINEEAFAVGAHWSDFDNDGDQDLMSFSFNIATQKGAPVIYENMGNGSFSKSTPSFLDKTYSVFGANAVDYDNDGFTDIILSIENEAGIDFYKGEGDMTFTKVDNSSLGELGALSFSEFNSTWADVNEDGLLDILVWEGTSKKLFKQNPNHSFTELVFGTSDTDGIGMALWSDYDLDGDVDVLLSNSENAGPLRIYVNNGNETFTKATGNGFDAVQASLAAWGDYNNDGYPDIYVSAEAQHALYRNLGNGNFAKDVSTVISNETGNPGEGFGVATWLDANKDGFLDLLITGFGIQTSLFVRDGSQALLTFIKYADERINDPGLIRFGMATADYDEDGDVDVFGASLRFTEQVDGALPSPDKMYDNVSSSGHWSLITLNPTNGNNEDAIGTKIGITAGSQNFYREVGSATGFASTDSKVLHFGLGNNTTISNIRITWPNGGVQNYPNPPINQVLNISEDFQGPSITLRTPNHQATNVVVNSTLSITLNENATVVSGKTIQVIEVGQTTPLVTLLAESGVKDGNQFTYTLGTNLGIDKQYQITIQAGAFRDIYGNESAQVAAGDWTFTTSSGPQLTARVPANNANNVNASTQLQLTFDVPTTGVAGKYISVFTGTSTTATLTLDAGNAVATGNTQSLSFPFAINNEVTYRIVVEAGAFIDANGAPSAAIADGEWTFTTVAGPKVTMLTPADEQQTVNANTTLALEFDKAVTPEADKSLRLYQAGVTDPIYTVELSAGTASLSNRKYTYTLPQKLANQANFSVIVDVRSFADANGNLFIGVGAGQWDFRTTQGPNIATYAPAAGATDVAVNAPIVLTFDRNIVPVTGKKVRVYNGPTTTLIDADVSTTGTVATNRYTLPAPAEGWPYQTQLAVQLDEAAFTDTNLNDAAGITGVQYTFTTVEAPDTQAPAITFTPPASFDKGFGTQTISVEVTDNKGVTGAKFFFRPISGTTFSEANGEGKANNRWEFSVPETAFDANGLQYYFTAVDAAGNTARQPATGFNTATLRYTSPIEVTTALGFGGQKNNWKIFAMPFVTTSSITALFDELTGTVKQDYRIITYQSPTSANPNGSWSDYPDFNTFTRGLGYFVNIKEVKGVVTLSSGLTVPNNNRDNLFQMNLKQGWNQIGNPYLTAISWNDVAAYNSLSGQLAELKTYNGSAYVNTTNLAAFTGGFVFAPSATTISIPFLGQTSGGRLKETTFAEGEWLLPITLAQGDARNEDAGIGMHREAVLSFDDLDRVNVPRFIDFAEINFSHPEHFARNFVRDVVPLRETHEWTFTVESNQEGLATLQWDASAIDADLYLYDESLQKPVNMREVNTYTFDPWQSGRFRIFYGDNALQRISPHRVTLGNAFPNPSSGKTHIPFTLPERNGLFQVQMEVFDMMGRKVATVLNKELPTGFYQADWEPGELPTDGLYTYRLSVSAGNNSEVLSGKVLMKK